MTINNMKMGANGIALLKNFEGCRVMPYNDSAGLKTVGIGHLIKPGEDAHWEYPLTQIKIMELFHTDVSRFEAEVNKLVTVKLNQNQFDALVSFDYNTGSLSTSTLLKKLNSGDLKAAGLEFLRWVHAGSATVILGLVTRRREEKALFEDTKISSK